MKIAVTIKRENDGHKPDRAMSSDPMKQEVVKNSELSDFQMWC